MSRILTKEECLQLDIETYNKAMELQWNEEDIVEEVCINVPIGLSEEDEDKFIDNVIGRDYAYLYGR